MKSSSDVFVPITPIQYRDGHCIKMEVPI